MARQGLWAVALSLCLLASQPAHTAALPNTAERTLPFAEESLFNTPSRQGVPRTLGTDPLAGTVPAAQEGPQRDLVTKEDLLIVIPTSLSRMALVDASRRWRRGVRTYLVADKVLPFQLREKFRIHRETWGTYEDIKASELDVGARQGDLRAAMAPFMANITFPGKYKWILYGDDDTVMFIDNVLHTLNTGYLDWRKPYLVSDCLWWPEGGMGTKLHPNREAPRCLPCGFKDPLLDERGCPGHKGFLAPLGCPCSPALVLQGHWAEGEPKFEDGKGIFDRKAPDFVHRPGSLHSPYIGWWYMIHGGAGALISRTAMERNTFEAVHGYMHSFPPQSGDAMLSRTFWFMLALAPTDPGYGFCRKHVQMFDPGFAGYRARGKEDAGAADGGADPLGVLQRLEWALSGSGCDSECHDQLEHTISVHVRGRHVAEEWWQDTPKDVEDASGHEVYQVACHVIERLALLGEQYSTMRNSSGRYLPRWSEDIPQEALAAI